MIPLDTYIWRRARRIAREYDDLDPSTLREALVRETWAMDGLDSLAPACLARIEALEGRIAEMERGRRAVDGQEAPAVALRVVA